MKKMLCLLVLLAASVAMPALAAPQNDAGSGGDAGGTLATATPIAARGYYSATLDRGGGDADDLYRFPVQAGTSLSVLVELPSNSDPVLLLDPDGRVVDAGIKTRSVGASASAAFTTETTNVRLAIHRALTTGDYFLHVRSERFDVATYGFCFMNCEEPMEAQNDLIFGGSLPTTDTQVLLVPPSHGDLGDPFGPTVVDYVDATLRGIHRWTTAMRAFADDFPEYSYLKDIRVSVEIFDGVTPIDPAGFDVLIGYVAAGPVFRGVASDTEDETESILQDLGLDDDVHYSGRVIALSLLGSAPRAGQAAWDFPEVNDLEIVTIHEFGHTFGLGHTRTIDPVLGHDLMNSPAPFVYGNGSPVGDGGEHTAMKCLSSLNLYGMAELYSWVPSGTFQHSYGSVDLPPGMPYTWYC